MFCPNCGSDERHASQFCRSCGTDLRAVRISLERPDAITASAVSARDEIGRAIGAKIRDLKKAGDLAKIAEEVLPEIEKFLESPHERRLRRLRSGVVTTAAGLGGTVFFLLMGLIDIDAIFLMGLGVTVCLIGLGLILNALLFTVPAHHLPDRRLNVLGKELLEQPSDSVLAVNDAHPSVASGPPSVTEQTTQNLTPGGDSPQLRDRH